MRRRQLIRATTGSALVPFITGCLGAPEQDSGGQDDRDDEFRDDEGERLPAVSSPHEAAVTETVAMTNLELPWDIAFSAETDEVFLTERPGRIRRGPASVLREGDRASPDDLDLERVELPGFRSSWEAGAQGIALHPAYPDEPWVYLYYTHDGDSDEAEDNVNRVVRYDTTDDEPEIEVLVDEIPGSHIHNGGRIAFGPDGNLWITAGTGGTQDKARDPASLGGAILRVTPDGEPAGADIEGGDSRTVTYGHRNPQAIDWLADGTAVVAEHGPAQRDELHLLQEGRDYGWPVARNGPADTDYDSYLEHDFAKPIASSGIDHTWAPSGGSVYDADAIPEWTGRFLLGGLVSHTLQVFTFIDPDEQRPPDDAAYVHDLDWMDDRALAVQHERYEFEYGRLRHAAVGPEGSVYLLTSNTTGPIQEEYDDEFPRDEDDVIIRIDPA